MSYRSEVRIALKVEDFIRLLTRKAKEGESKRLVEDNAIEEKVLNEKIGVVIFGWNWLKWYEEYEDVAFIRNFLNELLVEGRPYKFIRIGEDMDDTEQEYSYGNNDDYSCDEALGVYREFDY